MTAAASTPPNRTCSCPAAPEKLRPVIVTELPPPVGPPPAPSPVTTGVRSTTSKSVALIAPSRSMASMFHWSDGSPWKNMSAPLSATISP